MTSSNWMDALVNNICQNYTNEAYHRIDSMRMPSKKTVKEILDKIKMILFPGYFASKKMVSQRNIKYFIGELVHELQFLLEQESVKAKKCMAETSIIQKESNQIAESVRVFLESIPKIRDILKDDILAAFHGDPAAKSIPEVIVSYPCFEVMIAYRLAHQLYNLQIELIPRIMTELAHTCWGVDIHPGAKIGRHFFIDHGTGVVIGETTEIGDRVKIYQGVTLGALSFPRDSKGQIIKGIKRHPTIENNVTIYAGATILGGETVIGENAVIGGNAWIIDSVPPGDKVKGNSKQ